MKKTLSLSVLVLAVTLSGCHHLSSKSKPAPVSPDAKRMIVTPDSSLEAKVVSVRMEERFVVLNFPSGRMPKLDQHLFLYRDGLRTAEVKVVGPQQDSNIVADIISGQAQPGELVREE